MKRNPVIPALLALCLCFFTPCVLAQDAPPAAADQPRKIKLDLDPDILVFTEPLREDGTVDYIAAINKKYSEGVTKENNAFRELLPLYVQGDEGGEWIHIDEQAPEALKRLGLKLGFTPNELSLGPHLQSEKDFLIGLGHSELEAEALVEPYWNDFPHSLHPDYVKWVESMEPVFKRAVTALDKGAYWVPIAARDDESSLAFATLPHLACHRVLARGLRARACHAAATGDHAKMMASIRALRRLACFIRDKEAFLISAYVGISIEVIAIDTLRVLIEKRSMAPETLAELSEMWLSVPPPKSLAALIQVGERANTLDAYMHITARRLEDSDLAVVYRLYDRGDFDVNRGIQQINTWYKAHAKTSEPGSFKEREQAIAEFQKAFDQYRIDSKDQFQEIEDMLLPTPASLANRRSRAEAFTSLFLSQWFPALGAENRVEARLDAQQRCALTTIAIERFRLKHHELPDSLDELVPDYLAAVPNDPYNGQSLRYKQSDTGYVVYAVGENLQDDGGLDDRREGDVVVEIEYVKPD